jgi:D-beta-D-heptose 7-phosphate kinase/D-beta-D-heptose 1-phosphate adenosyltransferase
LADCIGGFSAVLISDYGKGFCTPRILRAAIDGARRGGAPVLVDPALAGGFERYRGASLVKPNRREAELAAG